MQFTQSTIPELYYGELGTPSSPPAVTPQSWFLLPKGTPNPPPTISVSDSWQLFPTGVYIFLDEALLESSQSDFAQAAWNYLLNPSLKAVRFVWFSNPNQSANGLVGTSIAVYTPAGTTDILTSRLTSFDYQNLSLLVDANCPVQLNADESIGILQADSTNTSIYLTTQYGGQNLYLIGAAARLPLSGALCGCLQFPMTLGQTGGVADYVSLDVGLRYFYPTPSQSAQAESDGEEFWLSSLRYPVFEESQTGVQIYGNLDPLSIDDERSYFAFNAADAGLPPATPTTLQSNYVSSLGNPFSLVGADGASAPTNFARLAFAPNPQSLPANNSPFYLVPKGDFQVVLPSCSSSATSTASPPPLRLMSGLSGVEYVALQPDLTNYLSFFNGVNSFIQGFTPGNPVTASRQYADDDAPTTSWAYLSGQQSSQPASLTYYAQPNQSVLYQQAEAAAQGNAAALQPLYYLEVPTNTLPAAAATNLAFPLLPYQGVTPNDLFPPSNGDGTNVLGIFQQLEQQVISPLRRQTVITISKGQPVPAPVASPPPSPVFGTTPQGLLAQFAGDYSAWLQLILAQMPNNQQFLLTDIENNSALWNALQTNNLFLVISDPKAINAYLQAANSTISIGDPAWDFLLDPADWAKPGLPGTQGTIMILKFYGKSLKDLAADPGTWVQAGQFNQSPPITSSIIGQIIEQAEASLNQGDNDFAYFCQIVADANWNGILILNGNAPLSALPAELAGLASGINPAKFFAHHIGINASKINQTTTPITLQNSTLFGLINYEDQTPLVNSGVDYLFRVSSLKVLFANSQVAGFSSVIQLMVNAMFGERVIPPANQPATIITLLGYYLQQVLPDGTTQDSYFFQTAQGSSITLNMQSQVLNAVQINKAQYITQSSAAPSSPPSSQTQTRFVFWGLLDFVELEGFDLFSFGRETTSPPNTTPAGLNFANLALDLSVPTDDPSQQTFTFDASQISFDLAGSYARTESFFNRFPITLTGLTQAKVGTTPTGAGFMSVQSPLNQSSLNYPWFSLNFNLNLGTLGALAGEVGFVASFVAAWSPGSDTYRVFTGLSLPGSNGGKREISIEGVLKLTFKTLAIVVDTSSGTPAYILVFFNIVLSFLSKTFPPGQLNVVLFGDPDPQGDNSTLGWYAAYAKPQSNTKGQSQTNKSLAAAAQTKEG